MVDVSIILVNYKTPKLTYEAITSILDKSLNFSFEIIVVDNSNNIEEFNALRAIVPTTIQIINAKANLGFGKANNLGASHSNGKFLYFINTDTKLINNAIYELLVFSLHHYPCIAGSNLYTKDLKPNHSFISYERNAKNIRKSLSWISILIRKILRKRNDFNYSNKPLELDGYVCGASLMIPKEYFDKVDGFDKDIFMYAEDNLLCYKLHENFGVKLYNIPNSKIIHYEGGSFNKSSEEQIKRIIDGNKIYFTKAFGKEDFEEFILTMVSYYKKKRFVSFILNQKDKKDVFKLCEEVYLKEMHILLGNKK